MMTVATARPIVPPERRSSLRMNACVENGTCGVGAGVGFGGEGPDSSLVMMSCGRSGVGGGDGSGGGAGEGTEPCGERSRS